jgi:hypothetical protein
MIFMTIAESSFCLTNSLNFNRSSNETTYNLYFAKSCYLRVRDISCKINLLTFWKIYASVPSYIVFSKNITYCRLSVRRHYAENISLTSVNRHRLQWQHMHFNNGSNEGARWVTIVKIKRTAEIEINDVITD